MKNLTTGVFNVNSNKLQKLLLHCESLQYYWATKSLLFLKDSEQFVMQY